MTDRHIHCVYFQHYDKNNLKGRCLLKKEHINSSFGHSCDKLVLRPYSVLSYFLKHEGYCSDWKCADKKALEYLEKTGYNTYPK